MTNQADALHEQGRAAGSAGDQVKALELFFAAHELEPDWPYPPYDIAFTYLLAGQLDEAEKWYALVDQLAPRGFFTAKSSLAIIRVEQRGDVPKGFAKSFAMLEWAAPDKKLAALQHVTHTFPSFAPGWKEYASMLDDPDAKLAAFERGIAANPDDETYGNLIVNKAITLDRIGRRDEARALKTALLADPRCTEAAEAIAKQLLK